MDHAIEDLKERIRGTIAMYEHLPKKELAMEIKPYVDAINILVKHYYLPKHQHEYLVSVEDWIKK